MNLGNRTKEQLLTAIKTLKDEITRHKNFNESVIRAYELFKKDPDDSKFNPKPWGRDYCVQKELIEEALKDLRKAWIEGFQYFVEVQSEFLEIINRLDGGWGKPTKTGRNHFFINGYSLCGRYSWSGNIKKGIPNDAKCCKICLKKRKEMVKWEKHKFLK